MSPKCECGKCRRERGLPTTRDDELTVHIPERIEEPGDVKIEPPRREPIPTDGPDVETVQTAENAWTIVRRIRNVQLNGDARRMLGPGNTMWDHSPRDPAVRPLNWLDGVKSARR